MENNSNRIPSIEEVSGEILLTGEFSLYPKSKSLYNISLTSSHIHCVPCAKESSKKSIITLSMKDIVGCECMKGKTEDDVCSYLAIYAYPHKKKFASKKTQRRRQSVTITFAAHATRQENEKESTVWRNVIKCLLKKIPITSSQGLWIVISMGMIFQYL